MDKTHVCYGFWSKRPDSPYKWSISAGNLMPKPRYEKALNQLVKVASLSLVKVTSLHYQQDLFLSTEYGSSELQTV